MAVVSRQCRGGDGYNEARKQASEAIGELGAIIRASGQQDGRLRLARGVVKTAAAAFPYVAAQCQAARGEDHISLVSPFDCLSNFSMLRRF